MLFMLPPFSGHKNKGINALICRRRFCGVICHPNLFKRSRAPLNVF
uniref:Uncharacterized protein n=1 Tax=Siphoviridae sp. ctwhn18 TaxID=2825733 RepID=A0A8S5NYT4_9CAUD|nr:MAG TPA: hypothetical protein [Siphoviridae sp. ctwhn18]